MTRVTTGGREQERNAAFWRLSRTSERSACSSMSPMWSKAVRDWTVPASKHGRPEMPPVPMLAYSRLRSDAFGDERMSVPSSA